jgi:DNA replication and repair protein RecF
MLCFTKSFLQNPDQDCVKYNENSFRIAGDFGNVHGLISRVTFNYDKQEGNKSIEFNGEPVRSLSSFFGRLPLVVLSPGDIKLTSGTPADRRRNFDILISQISRVYLDDLRSLNRVIRQKNSLLKENFFHRRYRQSELKKLIEGWNQEMVRFGVRILIKRLNFVIGFRKFMELIFESMVGDVYKPLLDYESELISETGGSVPEEGELESKFERILEDKFVLETRRGVTLAGPQRDDYVFRMKKNGHLFDVKSFASQGEHKTFIIALKLSEYMYLKDNLETTSSGEPVLLLDDLFSELDRNRVNSISSFLPNFNQIFLTTTDITYLDNLKKYLRSGDITVFHIVNGTAKTIV